MKKIKMIAAVIVAIVSLAAIVGIFYNDASAVFVIKKTPGVQWILKRSLEKEVAEYQKLDTLIAITNLQIDSLAHIEQKTTTDELLKSNYEIIRNDYVQQKSCIDREINGYWVLMELMIVLIYLLLCIFAIVYIVGNIQKKKISDL